MPTVTEVYDDASAYDDRDVNDSESGEDDGPAAGPSDPSIATPSSKKKKKKRSKVSKVLNTLKGKEVPQVMVDKVMEKVNEEHGDQPLMDEESIRRLLEQLKVNDVLQGKAGLGGKNKKDMGDHKFWSTQPVQQFDDAPAEQDGPLEPSRPREEVRQEPYPLPKDFEWSTIDLDNPAQIKELYELLSANYVEDDQASFRFQYSAEFLEWALKPPGYHKECNVGVRVSSNKKLVAFISGVPITLRVRENRVEAVEVNYLCIRKKLRSKRLAPVLIKELTRQCHLKGIFQAIYTGGIVIPTPVSTCRYFHRTLNVPKLVDVKFTFVPRNMTLARMIRLYKVPSTPHLARSGLREMEDRDVEAVAALYSRYMERFDLVPLMSVDEVLHQFMSGRGVGEISTVTGRRDRQNSETHKITDFFSFYSLPSTVINHPRHNLLEAAYLFYYASDVAFEDGTDDRGLLKHRVQELIADAIIIADQAKFDVFNALTLMDNMSFLSDLKFGQGDGLLNFYLYNWRTKPLAGINAVEDRPIGRGVGVVML
ncbi:Myristoyl-CoA:protein N-myristoyltransferase, N-terminal domain-containing protein [Vararia minispora EC-137]|uniref:Myristoyl-CoA:protein N-myristoyltransferase, N-terminal domain-containing protein n=1 Tax=Vararia minispora EC-137 TaxID=1314806 RepID=A0ACB8QRL8_9AGAM|nr:Myristoyl-CoA:protein N-myristoyltransferase, N-terminal domain-containing protein [Vararia minispora EC-137]